METGEESWRYGASQRKRKYKIVGLHDHNGCGWRMKSEIVSSIEDYFRGIFAQSNLHKLTILLQPWNMRCHQPTKTPGPDGMSCFSFQIYWHIIGEQITTTVQLLLFSKIFTLLIQVIVHCLLNS